MREKLVFLLLACWMLVCAGCSRHDPGGQPPHHGPVVVAIEGDIGSFNPLFAEDVTSGEINDLFFPGLVGADFDTARGALVYTPLLARSWERKNGNRDLLFHLKSGVRWADGQPVTARDVRLSYELYGDPDVASVRQGAVENLARTGGRFDVGKSIEVLDDTTLVFHFQVPSSSQLFDAGLPILPAHVFASIPRREIRSHEAGRSPVVAGPFALSKWTPLTEIVLARNSTSTLPSPARLPSLVYRVLPDYRTRVAQLQSGEVDVMSGLHAEDVPGLLKAQPAVRIISAPGRGYDFLGWNNIDPAAWRQSHGKVARPHPLFGSAAVRRALTMAINRQEIVDAYVGSHGRVAFGGISPLFKWAYNDTLKPLPFDPVMASRVLEQEGWKVRNGVREKNGVRFSFTLKVPAGNPTRNAIATVIQQQLRNVNIAVTVEQVERGTFWGQVTARAYDAWLAGISVPLQMQLDDLWSSDLAKHPFNLTGFRNARVDWILAQSRSLTEETDGAPLWKEFQVIVHEEQPCTFLYWSNTIIGVNERVRGTAAGVLGTTHKAWEWSLEGEDGGVVAQAR